jgi:hypothetical protein
MKRGLLILALGLVGAAVAFCCAYLMGTTTPRALLKSAQPELAWLQHEFKLGDAEHQRISELHAGYLPRCMERCRRIDELNDKLAAALATAAQVTPEIATLLQDRAQIRATCQSEMLKHFFEVSRTMPRAQGQRYLAWVWDNTCLREQPMDHGSNHHRATTGQAHSH